MSTQRSLQGLLALMALSGCLVRSSGTMYAQPAQGSLNVQAQPAQPGYATVAPPAQPGYATVAPPAQPVYAGVAQPAYPAAQPVYPVAQPAQPVYAGVAQPAYPAAQPAYPAAQPVYSARPLGTVAAAAMGSVPVAQPVQPMQPGVPSVGAQYVPGAAVATARPGVPSGAVMAPGQIVAPGATVATPSGPNPAWTVNNPGVGTNVVGRDPATTVRANGPMAPGVIVANPMRPGTSVNANAVNAPGVAMAVPTGVAVGTPTGVNTNAATMPGRRPGAVPTGASTVIVNNGTRPPDLTVRDERLEIDPRPTPQPNPVIRR